MFAEYYLLLKALHLIAVIAWMAGMLYLPRLFVYHTQTLPGKEDYDRFLTMERRLIKRIMLPAMIATFVLGLLLTLATKAWVMPGGGWFHAKIGLVLIMGAAHGMMVGFYKGFACGENRKTERFFRIFNEVPAVVMVLIVILAVLKPF